MESSRIVRHAITIRTRKLLSRPIWAEIKCSFCDKAIATNLPDTPKWQEIMDAFKAEHRDA